MHGIGLCSDSFAHYDLFDFLLANQQTNNYIKINQVINYVTERIRGGVATPNKRKRS